MKPINARHTNINVLSRSARDLFAAAATNTAGAPINSPYRPHTTTVRRNAGA